MSLITESELSTTMHLVRSRFFVKGNRPYKLQYIFGIFHDVEAASEKAAYIKFFLLKLFDFQSFDNRLFLFF